MKKCIKCGCELEDDALFCLECGTKQSDGASSASTSTGVKINLGKNLNVKKIFTMVGIPLITLLICFGLFKVFYKPTIDLNEYIAINYKGYDSVGKIEIAHKEKELNERLDKILPSKVDKLLDKIDDQLDLNFKNKKELKIHIDNYLYLYEIDNTSKLLNGDTINFTWNLEHIEELQELAELCGFKVKAEDRALTVEGLKEVGLVDVFENLEYELSGISGSGWIYFKPIKEKYYARVENNGALTNGDKVTVYLSDDDVIRMIEDTGKRPNPASKEIEIQGLNEYVKTVDQLNEETLSVLMADAQKAVINYVEKYYDKVTTVHSINCEKVYVLSKKDESTYGDNDKVEILFKINSTYHRESFANDYWNTQEAYYVVGFANTWTNSEGDLIEGSKGNMYTDNHRFSKEVKSTTSNYTMDVYYHGHESIEEYEQKHLKDLGDTYSYTSREPLSKESFYSTPTTE